MITLDVRTLLFIFTLFSVLSFIVMVLLWWQNRRSFAGIFFWVIDYFMQMLALVLIYLRGNIPDWLSLVLPNSIALAGILILLIGLQRFIGKKYSQVPNYVLLAVMIGLQTYFSAVDSNLTMRNFILNSGSIIFVGQAVWLLWRSTSPKMPARGPLIALAIIVLVSAARIIEQASSAGSNNDFFKSGSADMILFALQQLAIIYLTYQLILMVNRRLILDLHHSEEHLRASEEKFAKAFHSNPQALAITSSKSGLFLEVNEKFLTDIGYSREELIGYSGIKLGIWPDENKRQEAIAILIKYGRVLGYEIDFRTKSGEIHTWILSGETLEIEDEPCIIWMNVDITERKHMVKALQESESFNASLSENSPYPIIVMNLDTSVNYVNPAFEKLIGFHKEEVIGLKQPYPWWSSTDIKLYLQEGALDPISNNLPMERTYFNKNGEEIRVELYISNILKETPNPYFLSTWVDITAQKKVENQLKQSNAYIQAVLDNMPVGVAVIKTGGKVNYINKAYQQIHGWPAEKLTSVRDIFRLIFPDPAYRTALLEKVVADVNSNDVERMHWDGLNIVTATGQKKVIAVDNYPISGQDLMISTVRDITRRVQIQTALEESEERFRSTLDNLFEGGQIIDFNWRYVYINKMALRQGRKPKDELMGKTMMEVYPGIENTPLFQSLQKCMQDRISTRIENEFKYRNGESGWFDLTIQPVKEGLFILSLEITDRKVAEDALRQSEENYRNLFTNMTEAFALHEILLDKEGNAVDYRFLEVNQAFEALTGLSATQIVDKTAREVLPGLEEEWIERYAKVALCGEEAYFESYNHNLDRWYRVYAYSPKKFYFVTQFTDITSGRKAQEELRQSEEKYRTLFENMAQGAVYQNANGEVISINAAARKILNVSKTGQLKSTQVIDAHIKAIHEDGTEFLAEDHPSMQSLRSGQPVNEVIMGIYNPNLNSYKWIKINAMPRFQTGEKKPFQVFVTFEDVTSIKKAELMLKQSEEVFRYNFDLSPVGAAIVAPDYHFLRVNAQFCLMLGYTDEELSHMTFKDLTLPDDLGKDTQQVNELVLGHITRYQTDKRYLRKDGTIIWGNVSINAVRDSAGKLLYFMPRIVDISERKQMEENLKEANQLFSIVANTSPALVWMSGTDKLCTWFNDTWLKFTGRTMAQEIGNGWAAGVHPEDLERCLQTYTTAFDKRQPFNMEYRLRRYDGEYRWIMDPGIPRYDFKGNFVGYIGSCLDVTERRQAADRMLEVETLERLNQAKSDLLANVSHELRTPLASIKGFIETLIEPDVKWSRQQQLDFLRSADMETDHLTFLIRDLLDMSRLDSGKMVLDKRDYTIEEILDAPRNVAASLAAKNTLVYSLADNLPRITADKGRLGQVITNLVENAVKFSKEGSPITIGVKQGAEQVVFSVEDQGEGMSKEVQKKLFNRFYQAERVVSGKTRGTGLGLAICKGIIEAHGGTIWVESQTGKGSKFYFSIPYQSLKE